MTRTERTYYTVFAFYCASWALLGPVYPIFLLSRGLNLFEINLVLATYLITAFVFEVPTGAVADLVGRKISFLLSCALRCCAFALYAFAHSFFDCVVAEFIDAVGTTLASGALDAWAVDGMHADGDRRPADRLFARAQMIARPLMIVGGITGGYLGSVDFTMVWFVAASGFVLAGLIGWVWMREERRSAAGSPSHPQSLVSRIRAGFAAVRRAPVAIGLCVLTMTTAFGMAPMNMLWPPRVASLTGEGTWLLGWIWALINVMSFTGSAIVPRLGHRVSRGRLLCIAALWRGAMFAIIGAAATVTPVVAALLLQEVSFGMSDPLLQAWMSEQTDSEQRATVLSVRAMSFTFGGAAGLVIIGFTAQHVGISAAWFGAAAALLVTSVGFIVLGRLAHPKRRRVSGEAAPVVEPASKVATY